jgi:hypothetical protein
LTPEQLKVLHAEEAKRATFLYQSSRSPSTEAAAWQIAMRDARKKVAATLRASKMLVDVETALRASGSHMQVLRQLMAPPISQDQFKLLCPRWPKSTEKKGMPMKRESAALCAQTFATWRQRALTAWLDRSASPSKRQVRLVLTSVAPLVASQEFSTALRNLLANKQERTVTTLLDSKGWTKSPSKLVDTRAALPAKHYMHKTRFATATARPQEVDVACGLQGTYVLAMECKVTNDETNSVKRINDVLKKAAAWKQHWGSFVETAALLQGVIAAKDVARLIDAGVHVFWSHKLSDFEKWLAARA